MEIKIFPSKVNGIIHAPAGKSMTQRALAAALLCRGTTTIYHPSHCDDSMAALGMIKNLGAQVVQSGDEISVLGGFLVKNHFVNCGESGLAMRMFAPIAALHHSKITFNGKGSLNSRPVNMIGEALMQLGVDFNSNNGFLPFTVQGPLKGGYAEIDSSVSSQLLTGLLMALPCAGSDSEISVKNLKSKPYVAMTLQLLSDFGIEVENRNFENFRIRGNQQYKACEYTVDGDWSGAAFMLVAGAISGTATIKGLKTDSLQSDRAILDALQQAGALFFSSENSVEVSKSQLNAFQFDATDCPDLFPPLAALAANCNGKSIIKGVSRLIHKESNRAETIQQELSNLGIHAEISADDMLITGGKIKGGSCDSHHDHRIAMMISVLALNAEGIVTIENAECVNKSYPAFYEHLKKIGVNTEQSSELFFNEF